MNALCVTDITDTLDGTTIVSDINWHVAPGEWHTIIGPNGAGKSTLLHAIAGVTPATGTIQLNGTNIADLTRRDRARMIALVAQNPIQPPGINVFDYLMLGRTPHIRPLGRESTHDIATVMDVCDRLDLTTFTSRNLATLSGGERQRVYLGRALTQLADTRHGVLLLDEPTSALDIGHQQDVLELVDTLRTDTDNGLTVISTMHDLTIAGEYADQLVMLVDGHIVAHGPPVDVLTAPLLTKHYRANVRIILDHDRPIVVPARGQWS